MEFKPGQTFDPVEQMVRRARRRHELMSQLAALFWVAVIVGLVLVLGGPDWAAGGFGAVGYFAMSGD